MNKKIKILFFMDGIGNAGGIQEMTIKWMENIDKTKYQIDILSYNSGKKDNYPERVAEFGGKVYLIESYMHKGKLFESLKQTDSFFYNHKDYDILHAHSSSKALFIMYYAKKYGIKTRILHSHCTKFVVKGKVKLFIAEAFKIPTLKLTTDYYACSPEAGEFLFGKKAMNRGAVTIIHNGINIELFKPNKEIRMRMRKELGVEKNFVVGNVGRFRPQKNHIYLIDIFEAVYKVDKDAVLICAGNGELEQEIKEKTDKLGISDRVKFLGFRNDVNDLMQAFDVLVMPSLFEGLPVTGVEAQAIGIPVLFATTITKDAAILPESDYMDLRQTPEQWAQKILEFKNINHTENSEEWIEKRGYNIAKETKKMECLYSKYYKKRG